MNEKTSRVTRPVWVAATLATLIGLTNFTSATAQADGCFSPTDCSRRNECTTAQCIQFNCVYAALTGNTCSDSNACTISDACSVGVTSGQYFGAVSSCLSGAPRICTASDQCHNAGTCNTSTGVCSNPPMDNGIPCNDSNACTQADTCQSGTCSGSTPVVCLALDQCHDVGTCNTATGVCSNPLKANGTTCSDGDDCTVNDTCNGAGACVSGTPVPDCTGCPFVNLLPGEAGRERILGALRNYRDVVLDSSVQGRQYADLYYAHADEVSLILRDSPEVRREVFLATARLIPVVEDVLSSKDAVVLTREELQTIDHVLGLIGRQAGPELSQDIEDLRGSLRKGAALDALGVRVESGPSRRSRNGE